MMRKICFFLSVVLCLSMLLGLLGSVSAVSGAETSAIIGDPVEENTSYAHYRIPGIVVTKADTLIAYWEARSDAGTDTGRTDIIVRRSADGGKTFTDCLFLSADEYANAGYGDTLTNPIMIVGNDGRLHMMFMCECGNAGVWYLYSDNDGVSWSTPVNIVDAFQKTTIGWTMCNFGPGHAICLQYGENAGRLIAPVWCYMSNTKTYDVYTVYSDDNGVSWKMGERVAQNLDESCIVERSDGSVMINSRQYSLPYDEADPNRTDEEAYRAISVSKSGVDGWADTYFDKTLIDPACQGSMLSTAIGGRHAILFVNNASKTERGNLTVRCSFDNGRSWVSKAVSLDHVGGYSDIAVDSKGTAYVIHEDSSINASNGWKLAMEVLTFDLNEAFGEFAEEATCFVSGSNAYQTKITEDGFCIRFVSQISFNYTQYSKVGFEVSILYDGDSVAKEYKLESNSVYESLQSGDTIVTPAVANYFVAEGILGIPTDGGVTFTVRPYAVMLTGEIFYGESSEASFYCGETTEIKLANGDCHYFSWEQLVSADQ